MVSGYCGNKAATFPLQLLGFDVDVMNTVSFSNHTGYPSWTGERATGDQLKELFKGLETNGLAEYSHLLTGYIGSAQNLTCVAEIIAKLQGRPFYVMDPVMGDHGQLYVQPDVIPVYKDMMKFTKAITPNQFEAEILTDTKITNVKSCLETINLLHNAGVEHVVITSVSLLPEDIKANSIEGHSQSSQPRSTDTDHHCNGHNVQNGDRQSGTENNLTETLYCVCSSKAQGESVPCVYAIGFPTYDGYFTGTGDLFSAVLVARLYEALNAKHNNEHSSLSPSPLSRACLKVVATMRAVVLRTYKAQEGTKGRSVDRKQAEAAAVVKRCELRLIQSKRDIEDPDMEEVEAVELKWIA
ncbi:putative pyridoxal kinase [Podila epigama]|nr:putative pyridoxal kinase [Podila epigama]